MSFEKFESSFNNSLTINEIYSLQEEIFYHYLGVRPDRNIRLLSPFRSDKRPGCRFEYFNGIWWFVDNSFHKNKLYFDCIDIVKELENADFKEACKIISIKIKPRIKPNSNYFRTNKKSIPRYSINIKFKYTKWGNKNYFSDNYFIDPDYLNKQPYYNVTDYWCNTRLSLDLVRNRFGKAEHKIAYYFKNTGHVKLYFPNTEFKWYSNCNDEIFGFHRIEDYKQKSDKNIFFCSGGKDEMCLNYHIGLNTLGLQSETTIKLPDYVMKELEHFDIFYIWLDADDAGREWSEKLRNILKKDFPKKKIIILDHSIYTSLNDIADITNNKQLTTIFNKLI